MSDANERKWPLEDTAALQIIDGLYRCRKFVWNNDQRIVAKYGLTWTQLMIIEALRDEEPSFTLSPTQLTSKTQATSGGMAKMLRGLEQSGFIRRIENTQDQRSRLVKLTTLGAETVETALNELARTNTEVFLEILSQEECEDLAASLAKLRRGLMQRFDSTER